MFSLIGKNPLGFFFTSSKPNRHSVNFSGRRALYATILLHTGAGNWSPQCLMQTFMMSHPCKTHYTQEGTVSLKVYVAVIFKWYFSSPT